MKHTNKPLINHIHIANQLLFSLTLSTITLLSLSILYHDFHIPTLRQLSIGLLSQTVFILIWRHYVRRRMLPKPDGDIDACSSCTIRIWHLSCLLFLLGNCLVPLQIVFVNQLRDDGDPHTFSVVCAACHAFADAVLGLNVLADIAGCSLRKSGERANSRRRRSMSMALRADAKVCRFRSLAVFLLSATIVLTGALMAFEDPIVVDVRVPIPHLPDSLDGFRIVQLSDMHVGVTVGRTRVARAVEIVNGLCAAKEREDECRLVAFTGDLIDGEPHRLRTAIEPLARLAPVPKLFVAGNHEHIHRNVEHVVRVLSEMGIDSVINDNVRLPKDSREQLAVVGLSDFSFRQSRGEQQAFEGTKPKEETIILLAHQPNHLRVARRHGVDLMLSGHTHAGQFFPGTLGAWLFNAKYSGFYPGETNVYVSAGTWWWGPPVRFTTRHHEIADIRLRKAK